MISTYSKSSEFVTRIYHCKHSHNCIDLFSLALLLLLLLLEIRVSELGRQRPVAYDGETELGGLHLRIIDTYAPPLLFQWQDDHPLFHSCLATRLESFTVEDSCYCSWQWRLHKPVALLSQKHGEKSIISNWTATRSDKKMEKVSQDSCHINFSTIFQPQQGRPQYQVEPTKWRIPPGSRCNQRRQKNTLRKVVIGSRGNCKWTKQATRQRTAGSTSKVRSKDSFPWWQ